MAGQHALIPHVVPLRSVQNRGLSAIAQAESLKYKLLGGLAARRACYGVIRYERRTRIGLALGSPVFLAGSFIMESQAKGVQVVLSGKLRGQRAKGMIFRDGYMIKSGEPKNFYIDRAVRHILLKQGVLGINLKIMLPYDPEGKNGVARPQPDVVVIREPKEEAPLPVGPKQGYAQNYNLEATAQAAVCSQRPVVCAQPALTFLRASQAQPQQQPLPGQAQ